MKGKIKAEKGLVDINVDSEMYAQSVHGGIDCIICHKQFSADPHQPQTEGGIPGDVAALANNLSRRAKVDPVAVAACVECHGPIYDSWKESVHGMNIIDKKQSDGAVCTDCHGSPHYITDKTSAESMVNKRNIVKVCGECHENEELAKKYGFGEHILERYYESFHGKKYILGHQKRPYMH
jgi:nitrate/TMAO reductase-like tetraheme cytochrome c subunit